MDKKELKTPIYLRNAIKRYEEKNKEIIKKKAREKYAKKKQEKQQKECEKTEWTIDDLIKNYNEENK